MTNTQSPLALMFRHLQIHIAIAKERSRLNIRQMFAHHDHAFESTSSSPLNTQDDVDSLPDSTNDRSVEDSSDVSAQESGGIDDDHSLSDKVLTEFSKFSEFPFEIRRLIYSFAATSEYFRFLPVEATLKEADEEMGLYFTFVMSPKHIDLPACFEDGDEFDIGMLSACTESRQVYLEHHKSILPAGFKSIIRYNPDRTIIHIHNFEDLQLCEVFADAVRDGWKRQKWFREIKQLSVPIYSFLVDDGMFDQLWGEYGHGQLMAVFENLETWRGLVHPGDWIVGREQVQRKHMEIMAAVVQGGLHAYKGDVDPDYKVPRVSVFEIVPPEDMEGPAENGRIEAYEESEGLDRLDRIAEYYGLDELDESDWVDEDDE